MNRRRYIGVSSLLATSYCIKIPDLLIRTQLKSSCNFYSFNEQLTSGSMTMEQAIDFCAGLGFDGVDITGYYFSNYPSVPDDDEIYHVKNHVLGHGMEISGTGVRNDFTQEDQESVASDLQLVKEWIRVAAKLGAPMLRIFAGKKLKAEQSKTRAMDQVITSFRQCIDEGSKYGIMITYQNHNDVLFAADEIMELMEELKDPWFGLNLDIGSLRMGDPYHEIKKLIPYARTWQIKEHVYRKGVKENLDVQKLAGLIKESNYQGFLPLETLPPSDPRVKLPLFLNSLNLELRSS